MDIITDTQSLSQHKTLTYVKNDRMAGSIASWQSSVAEEDTFSEHLNMLSNDLNNIKDVTHTQPTRHDDTFSVWDLVDMVNPLQHIPVVNMIYRALTGDDIKPIGQIVGGAIYGGPAGAGMSLVNVAIEHETGKDLAGNALSFAQNLSQERVAYDDLPVAMRVLSANPNTKEA